MQNKTDKLLDNIIKSIDKEKIYQQSQEKVQTWNGELSKKERIKLLKEGAIF